MKTNPRADAVRNALAQRWKGNGRKLESVRDGRRLVFTAQPEFIRNATGDVVGVDAWVRLYDDAGKELPIDPHRIIVNPPIVPRSGIKETVDASGKATRVLTPNPYEAFIEAVWDSIESRPNPSGWNTAGTVTTIYSDEDDGRITCTSSNYSTARAGNGTYNVNPTGNVSAVGQSFASPNYNVFQMFWGFDTSSIGADALITSIDFELNHALDNSATDFVLEIRERSWTPPLSSSHFVPGASLSGSGPIVAQRNTNTLPAVGEYWTLDTRPDMFRMANLGTGMVRMFGSSSRTRAGNTPSGQESVQFRFAEQTGTTQDPRLIIVHQTERAQAVETFETNPLTLKWVGDWGWATDSTHTGSFSWQSAPIGNSATSNTTLILPPDAQTLQFWYRVSSEAGWDHFRVYLDVASGTPELEESGNLSWRQSNVIDVSGASTVIFQYFKDTSNSSGSDCVWIDDVVLTFPVPSYSGGSSTSVSHSTSGAGRPGPKNGAGSTVSVSVDGVGRPATSGSSSVEVSVAVDGSGSPGWSDGSSTSVTVTSAGNGVPALAGGSDVSVTVEAVGAGEKGDISGGSASEVVVLASGDGFPSFAEGSTVEVAVSVSSGWTIAITSGSAALVKVVAVGRGIKPTVDITVDVGPSYVVERFGVLESRNGLEIGDDRSSLIAFPSVVLETVDVLLSRMRERVEIGETRSSVSVSDSRTSTEFAPSRVSRGV